LHARTGFANLAGSLPAGSEAKERVLGKFVENDFAKVVRLAEVHAEYQASLLE